MHQAAPPPPEELLAPPVPAAPGAVWVPADGQLVAGLSDELPADTQCDISVDQWTVLEQPGDPESQLSAIVHDLRARDIGLLRRSTMRLIVADDWLLDPSPDLRVYDTLRNASPAAAPRF